MSIYRCSGCQSYRDADTEGINATDTGDLLEYCDRCWDCFEDTGLLDKEQMKQNNKIKNLVKGNYD